MAKIPSLFSKIRSRVTRTGKRVKFAAVKVGADLSAFVPAPKSLLERLGIRNAFVPADTRATVRSPLVTSGMMSKAQLEREEGRSLARPEVKTIRGGKKFTAAYLKRKLLLDPRLSDPSTYHPSNWALTESFQWNWLRDQRRFLQLALDRTGARYQVTATGEWIKTAIADAPRGMMSADDWKFYTHHLYSNYTYYAQIADELLELPPGYIRTRAPRGIFARRGRANRTGRSQGSYTAPRRRAA